MLSGVTPDSFWGRVITEYAELIAENGLACVVRDDDRKAIISREADGSVVIKITLDPEGVTDDDKIRADIDDLLNKREDGGTKDAGV